MKSSILKLFLFFSGSFLFTFLFFSSCNEDDTVNYLTDQTQKLSKDSILYSPICDPSFLQLIQSSIYDTLLGGVTINTQQSYTMGPECVYLQHGWITHHYESKVGKFIGTLPRSSRLNNIERMRTLKDKYGFSYICFGYDQSVFDRALEVGFLPIKIMITINPDNFTSIINTVQSGHGNIYGYYLDEPIYHGYNPDITWGIKTFLVNNGYSSLLLTGDFKRVWPLGWIVENADKVLFTSYTKWWLLAGFWVSCCPWDPDQRSNWTDFRNSFGIKFSSTWVGAHKDLSEYDLLLGHAQNLNLEGVWLYQADDISDDNSDDNVSAFSYAAWRHGFLRRWVQDVVFTWRCVLPDPCDCDPACFPNNYYLDNISYGTIVEVFP